MSHIHDSHTPPGPDHHGNSVPADNKSTDNALDADGLDRRNFLSCMAWVGTGLIWTMSGGVPSSRRLGAQPHGAEVRDDDLALIGQRGGHTIPGRHPATVQCSGGCVGHAVERTEAVAVVPPDERFMIGAFTEGLFEDAGHVRRTVGDGRRR